MRTRIYALALLALFTVFACSEIDDNPVNSILPPAGKATTDRIEADSCLVIEWPCDPAMWMAPEDSVYTIFYEAFRFQTRGTGVHIEEIFGDNMKRAYDAEETVALRNRYKAAFRFTEDTCGLWSNAVTNKDTTIRIYKGDVRLAYRNLPQYKQYRLVEDGEGYRITRFRPEGQVKPIDFSSPFRRGSGPPSIDGNRYFLPVNFNAMAWEDMGSPAIEDDRPYLTDPFCMEDEECIEWEMPCNIKPKVGQAPGSSPSIPSSPGSSPSISSSTSSTNSDTQNEGNNNNNRGSGGLRLEGDLPIGFATGAIGYVHLTLPAASGGTPPYYYDLSGLPAGLSFDEDTRTVSGTPENSGHTRSLYTITDATDSSISFQFQFAIGPYDPD